jgi:hypothetical protein
MKGQVAAKTRAIPEDYCPRSSARHSRLAISVEGPNRWSHEILAQLESCPPELADRMIH